MNKSGFWALSALLVLCAAPASAQHESQGFDQYPSFIELTSTTTDGTQSVLRCGYTANGSTVALDKTFQEISVMNQAHKSYSRIQRIDNYLIATSVDPSGRPGMLIELIKPDNSATAKNCHVDTSSDTIDDCHTVTPFTFVDQVKAGDTKIAAQCEALMKQGGAHVNPAVADPQKTETFKAGLRQKVSTLAVP